MIVFAFTLQQTMRSELSSLGEGVFILYVLASFVCVAVYTAGQIRMGHLVGNENVPLSLASSPLSGWGFILTVVGLIYLQSPLYAIMVVIGIAGALVENGRSAGTQFGIARLTPARALRWSLLGFGAVMLVETPLTRGWAWVLDAIHLSHPEQLSVMTFRQYDRTAAIAWFMFQAVFLFPVVEELFFRGFLLTFLKNYTSTWMAIVLSAGVFASAHLNIGALVPLWFLGVVLGLAYEHTGSLVLAVGIHACFNLATALSLLADKGNP